MALLRCAADCVLIGSGTLRDDPHHQWTPSTPMPELAAELTAHRAALAGAAQPPPLAVVTASGELPAAHPALSAPQTDVLVITTEAGRPAPAASPPGARGNHRPGRGISARTRSWARFAAS